MDAIVESRCGKLRGRFSNGVTAFKGVPFAAPPFGANRLRPPAPVEAWDGVRDAFDLNLGRNRLRSRIRRGSPMPSRS